MKPEVSVIIPAYNCEKTIEKTISSALGQVNVDVELIVVNDYSTDRTYEVVENLAKTDARIKFYSNNQNLGVAQTRNIGCSHATGKYIAFLDADDFWEMEKLDIQLAYMKNKHAQLSYTSYCIIKGDKNNNYTSYRVPAKIAYKQLLKENVIGCSTVVLESTLMKLHMFRSDFFHEDYALWLEILRAGYTAIGVNIPLVYYRKGGRSSNKLKAAKNRYIIYRRLEKLPITHSLYYMVHYLVAGILKYVCIH
ncbi:MAG: glycosyltransferase family 2 protein [Angelakisella sp.]|nr:glycosyltransferase family 2 protein [Angelakisella sp.]